MKTQRVEVDTLISNMRQMEVGSEILLASEASGEGIYGIRRLPNNMFDNGPCWIADYYGGGSPAIFTDDEYEALYTRLTDWLVEQKLLTGDEDDYDPQYVYILEDPYVEDTKWEFKEIKIPPKNKLVCVNFVLSHCYRTYISVPPTATDNEIMKMAKTALINCTKEEFDSKVIDADKENWDLWPEDFADIAVEHDYEPTDLPTGTLSK